MSTLSGSKRFTLHSENDDDDPFYVEVNATDTLSDVRRIMLEDLDDDQLPPGGEFAFRVAGMRLSAKQEAKTCAFDVLEKEKRVEVVPRTRKRQATDVEDYVKKRIKVVTPQIKREGSSGSLDRSSFNVNGAQKSLALDLDSSEEILTDKANEADCVGESDDGIIEVATLRESNTAVAIDVDVDDQSFIEDIRVIDANQSSLIGVLDKQNKHDQVMKISHHALNKISKILQENDDFCSKKHRDEWIKSIQKLQENSIIQTVFGVLGSTGVGKSSLLNALLDEAAVLPTSGSQGCTAAVVELMFNYSLQGGSNGGQTTVAAYEGRVEFITNEDWEKEMTVLVEDCSSEVKKICSLPLKEDVASAWQKIEEVYGKGALEGYQGTPSDKVFQKLAKSTRMEHLPEECLSVEDWKQNLEVLIETCSVNEKLVECHADAADSWQKLEQVYGRDTMKQYQLQKTSTVLEKLSNNDRVRTLLTVSESGKSYNSIIVKAGEVLAGSEDAVELLKEYNKMNSIMKGKRAGWAKRFRQEINAYVYKKGNVNEPQTWPLIRKICLKGPWFVLSTGAVLVDLPGVKDCNAARAKVAQNHIQNCNQIAIVAPIKRAVDDETARELCGEQFKRRLLMDDKYSNIFFVCTQTDMIEPTETMHDHEDVAKMVPTRWEAMLKLSNTIADLKSKISEQIQEGNRLQGHCDNAVEQHNNSRAAMKQVEESLKTKNYTAEEKKEKKKDYKDMIAEYKIHKKAAIEARDLYSNWQAENSSIQRTLQSKCDKLYAIFKATCATVRNEYSKTRLQKQFLSGLQDLYEDDEDQDLLPPNFKMDVFCTSANDHLKLMKIKSPEDGPPSAFSEPSQTEIPQLQLFIHKTTASFAASSVQSFVENTYDLLDKMHLLAADVDCVPKSLLDESLQDLDSKVSSISQNFQNAIEQKIKENLAPSLNSGAKESKGAASDIVSSWGSKAKRTKYVRRPDKNGLRWPVYKAVANRSGEYYSNSTGDIDLNQELCDPMEKRFSTKWSNVFGHMTRQLLSDEKAKILKLCKATAQSVSKKLLGKGIDGPRLTSTLDLATRLAAAAVNSLFKKIESDAVKAQREASRELLPVVKAKMESVYESVASTQRGVSFFARMKDRMKSNSSLVLASVFDEAVVKLIDVIQKTFVDGIKKTICSAAQIMKESFINVFSICWEEGESETNDPLAQERAAACRLSILPELKELLHAQGGACQQLGMGRKYCFDIDVEIKEGSAGATEKGDSADGTGKEALGDGHSGVAEMNEEKNPTTDGDKPDVPSSSTVATAREGTISVGEAKYPDIVYSDSTVEPVMSMTL